MSSATHASPYSLDSAALNDPQEPEATNRLILAFNAGRLSVTMWPNKVTDPDGSSREFKTVSVRTSFRQNGELTSKSISINLTEVSCLRDLLGRMADGIIEMGRQEGQPF